MDPYNDLGRYGANKVERREPCPRCRAGGGDRSGDNLVVYLDGHKHCFSCGKHDHAETSLKDIRKLAEGRDMTLQDVADSQLNFPRDYVPLNQALYSKEGLQWLRKYGITDSEIAKHHIGWSTERHMLVFPVYDTAGKLIMWQGRNFDDRGQKYLTYGEKSDIMYLCGNAKSGTVVVTEDLISAIKVGRTFQSMPLWGSSMTVGLIKKLADRFDDMGVWLDSDKTRASVLIALHASQYIPTFVVTSTVDPKNFRDDVLAELVWSAQTKDTVYREQSHDPKHPKKTSNLIDMLPWEPMGLILKDNAHPKLLGPDGTEIKMTPDYTEHDWQYSKGSHGS